MTLGVIVGFGNAIGKGGENGAHHLRKLGLNGKSFRNLVLGDLRLCRPSETGKTRSLRERDASR